MSEQKQTPKLTDPRLDELCEKAARLGYRTAIADIRGKLLELYPNIKDKATMFIVFNVIESFVNVNKRIT